MISRRSEAVPTAPRRLVNMKKAGELLGCIYKTAGTAKIRGNHAGQLTLWVGLWVENHAIL
jgi:hypothetical protein